MVNNAVLNDRRGSRGVMFDSVPRVPGVLRPSWGDSHDRDRVLRFDKGVGQLQGPQDRAQVGQLTRLRRQLAIKAAD